MDNKEFAKKLEHRTRQFGISVIKLSIALPNSIEAKVNNERSKRNQAKQDSCLLLTNISKIIKKERHSEAWTKKVSLSNENKANVVHTHFYKTC